MIDNSPLIKAKDLTKSFGRHTAIDNISFNIDQGELFGFVGPDGAGKTTLIRILAGLLEISSGDLIIDGIDIRKKPESIKQHIGYMAQQFSLYRELSVKENLQFFGQLFGVPRDVFDQRSDFLLDFAGLKQFENRRASKLSGGMQKKLALACTLIHQPKILLMDEPTTGVDPISRREFWDILTNLHIEGTTIIVSTPYMDEADRCSQVGLIYQGQLLLKDEPGNIRSMIDGDIIKVVADDRAATEIILRDIPGVAEIQNYGESIHLIVDNGKKRIKKIKRSMKNHDLKYSEISITSPKMEEAFIYLIRQKENASSQESKAKE